MSTSERTMLNQCYQGGFGFGTTVHPSPHAIRRIVFRLVAFDALDARMLRILDPRRKSDESKHFSTWIWLRTCDGRHRAGTLRLRGSQRFFRRFLGRQGGAGARDEDL